jgi:hypothetical protein
LGSIIFSVAGVKNVKVQCPRGKAVLQNSPFDGTSSGLGKRVVADLRQILEHMGHA